MPDPRIFPIDNVNDTFVTVEAESTLVLAANRNRVGCDLTNDSKQTMYLARGHDAVIGSGFRLNANGGSYRIGTSNLWLGTVYAICADGQANLCVSEEYKP